jgi:hypothetical protein
MDDVSLYDPAHDATDARTLWNKEHSAFRSVKYTEVNAQNKHTLIVSTVLFASGTSARDGFFWLYETRVFGDGGLTQPSMVRSGDPQEGAAKAVRIHLDKVRALADVDASSGHDSQETRTSTHGPCV